MSFFVLFAIQSLCWDRGASKRGVRRSWRAAAYRSSIAAAGSLLIVPVATYLVCWLGWFAGGNSWNRHWADTPTASTRLNLPGACARPLRPWAPEGRGCVRAPEGRGCVREPGWGSHPSYRVREVGGAR